ncbi:tetratricopeptide repeat protein [Kitasatospora sp. MY 5-36]|uniref:AfsR/SARP family transcriptional regulator n=1 Tax=Kitasatospora sp. MY 5-36 TaxID=1678027 RepID=UPI0006708DEA|nr:tetratricopeptide repeat protein [Kitasatospora sp. MY 5-36]
MDGRVLGVVAVKPSPLSDGPVIRGTKKAAALFALMVTSPHGQCREDDVFRCLWPGVEFSPGRLHRAVSDLRPALGGREFLAHGSGMCSLQASRDQIDLYRFRDLLASAQSQYGKDRFRTVTAALAEWPEAGEALSGLTGKWAELCRRELRAEWLKALRIQFEAAYGAGLEEWLHTESARWHREFPEESWLFGRYLEQHAGRLPLAERERAIKRMMKKFRGRLDDVLQDIIDRLCGRPVASRPRPVDVPNQLPPRGRAALGREEMISDVVETVRRQEPGRPVLAAISGMRGIGTSLAGNHVAHRLRPYYPDGALYADFGGPEGKAEQCADPEYVIDRFLAEFPLPTSPSGLAEKSVALRSVLANRSVLILLDNVWDAAQVLPLLPGTGSSAVLVTSHRRMVDLQSRHEVATWTLGTLDDRTSTALLQEYIPEADHRKSSQEVKALVEFCGGHPLALTIAVQRFRGHPVAAIQDLRRQLKEEEKRLEALEHLPTQLSVHAAFACSVNALSEAARCLLWQLALHPGPLISRAALLDLGRAGEDAHPDRAAEELLDLHLVEVESDRYRIHSLLRTFARQRVHPEALVPGSGFEEATVRQVLEHQLQNAWACDQWLDGQRWLPVGEPQDVMVDSPADLSQALEALDQDYDTLVRGIELAVDRSCLRYTWLLPMVLVTYQWRRHLFADAQRLLGLAAEAAERCEADPVDQAMICRMRAGTCWHQRDFLRAAGHLLRAVMLSGQDGSARGRLSLARSQHTLALTRRKQGMEADAQRAHQSALELYRGLGDDAGVAAALNGLGTIHQDRGEHLEALRLCTEAFELVRETADHSGRADVLRTLAGIRFSLGERETAPPLYEEAAGIYRELGSWVDEARALWLLADVLVPLGRPLEAVVALERVVVLREQMGAEDDLADARVRLESLR